MTYSSWLSKAELNIGSLREEGMVLEFSTELGGFLLRGLRVVKKDDQMGISDVDGKGLVASEAIVLENERRLREKPGNALLDFDVVLRASDSSSEVSHGSLKCHRPSLEPLAEIGNHRPSAVSAGLNLRTCSGNFFMYCTREFEEIVLPT